MTDTDRQRLITGLINERADSERRGDAGHVEEINAELRKLGAEGVAPEKRAEKRPRPAAGKEAR